MPLRRRPVVHSALTSESRQLLLDEATVLLLSGKRCLQLEQAATDGADGWIVCCPSAAVMAMPEEAKRSRCWHHCVGCTPLFLTELRHAPR